MNRKTVLIVLSLLVVLSTALIGCGKTQEEQKAEGNQEEQSEEQSTVENNSQLLIYTSMYPLYDFAQKIAGDKAKVVNLVPAGASPHDFEPTVKDIIELSKADLFIYNGGGFETWIEKIIESVNSSDMVILESTAHLDLLPSEESEEHDNHDDENHDEHVKEEAHDDHDEHEKEEVHDNHDEHGKEENHDDDSEHGKEEDDHGAHEDDHAHEHGDLDPHVWLDPNFAKLQAEAIKNALVEIDAENAEYYESNFAELANKFDELDANYNDLNEHIERRDFVVSHAAFGYIASRYNLNQVAITGLSPSNEPSARQLEEIIEFVRVNQIQYIMFENLVTPKVADVVKEEVGAEALVLHNLEGLTKEEMSQGKDYFSIMEDNLDAFKQALGYN
jgi:zinc transport system substrate-binding protein